MATIEDPEEFRKVVEVVEGTSSWSETGVLDMQVAEHRSSMAVEVVGVAGEAVEIVAVEALGSSVVGIGSEGMTVEAGRSCLVGHSLETAMAPHHDDLRDRGRLRSLSSSD